jgi:hypothetical protein
VAIGSEKSSGRDFGLGALYITFLERAASVRSVVEIGASQLPLSRYDHFGCSISASADLNGDLSPDSSGDLDGDGLTDLAVGASGEDGDGAAQLNTGAVYLLFLNNRGALSHHFKLSNKTASETVVSLPLPSGARFGTSVALHGVDKDGTVHLAVGAPGVRSDRGAVYIINVDLGLASYAASRRMSTLTPKLVSMRQISPSSLATGERFGSSVAWIPDQDGDGEPELAVGAPGSTSATSQGAIYVVKTSTGAVLETVVSPSPAQEAKFGASIALGDDINGDGLREVLVGAPGESAVYLLRPSSDDAIGSGQTTRWDSTTIGVGADDGFGQSVAVLGRLDSDEVADVALGVPFLGGKQKGGFVNALLMPALMSPPPPSPLLPEAITAQDNLLGLQPWSISLIVVLPLLFIGLIWLLFWRRRRKEFLARKSVQVVQVAKQGEVPAPVVVPQSSYANLEEEMSSGLDLVGAATAIEQSNEPRPTSPAAEVDSIDVEVDSGAGAAALTRI